MEIVFDFDGVLCEYNGWRGHNIIGEPIAEMIDLVKKLHERGHTLKLSTTRLNPYPFGDERPDQDVLLGNAEHYIRVWLKKQGIEECFCEITGYKPYGDYYIDDKALRYAPLEKDHVHGGLLGHEIYDILLKEELE